MTTDSQMKLSHIQRNCSYKESTSAKSIDYIFHTHTHTHSQMKHKKKAFISLKIRWIFFCVLVLRSPFIEEFLDKYILFIDLKRNPDEMREKPIPTTEFDFDSKNASHSLCADEFSLDISSFLIL